MTAALTHNNCVQTYKALSWQTNCPTISDVFSSFVGELLHVFYKLQLCTFVTD